MRYDYLTKKKVENNQNWRERKDGSSALTSFENLTRNLWDTCHFMIGIIMFFS